jgi:hypothetical protein
MQPRRLRNQARYAREIRGAAEAWRGRDAAPGRAHERRRGHRGTGDGDPCLASASDRLTGRTARPCPARLPLKRHRAPRGSRATSSASGLAQPFASGASFGLTESIHRRRPPAPQRYRLSVPPSAARRMSLQAYFPIRHLPPRLRAWNSPPVPPRAPTLRRGAIDGACRLTAIWLVAVCRRPSIRVGRQARFIAPLRIAPPASRYREAYLYLSTKPARRRAPVATCVPPPARPCPRCAGHCPAA